MTRQRLPERRRCPLIVIADTREARSYRCLHSTARWFLRTTLAPLTAAMMHRIASSQLQISFQPPTAP